MILIPQDDDDKVDQSAHQKVISKELRMLSCKTALVIVNSNTSPGHRGQRRHSEVKAIEISMMILMMMVMMMALILMVMMKHKTGNGKCHTMPEIWSRDDGNHNKNDYDILSSFEH